VKPAILADLSFLNCSITLARSAVTRCTFRNISDARLVALEGITVIFLIGSVELVVELSLYLKSKRGVSFAFPHVRPLPQFGLPTRVLLAKVVDLL
jgi:hypothetical protein